MELKFDPRFRVIGEYLSEIDSILRINLSNGLWVYIYTYIYIYMAITKLLCISIYSRVCAPIFVLFFNVNVWKENVRAWGKLTEYYSFVITCTESFFYLK